jgi:hypothetical protein
MIDSPQSRPIVELPLPAAGWRPRSLRAASGRLSQALDIVFLCGAFAAVALLPKLGHEFRGWSEQLRVQASLRNVLIAVMCVATWRVILVSVGMYLPARSLPEYVLRCFVGLNCCTAVLGLIELVLRTGVDVWRLVGIYWLIAGTLMALVRLLVLCLFRPRRARLAPADQR